MTSCPVRKSSESLPVRPHPCVLWAVQVDGVRLIRRDMGVTVSLQCAEAALWDLISRRHVPFRREIYSIMEVIRDMSRKDAETWVGVTTEKWLTEGWLVEDEELHV